MAVVAVYAALVVPVFTAGIFTGNKRRPVFFCRRVATSELISGIVGVATETAIGLAFVCKAFSRSGLP